MSRAAGTGALVEMIGDEVSNLGQQRAVRPVGHSHLLRPAIDELREVGTRRVPGEELSDGHPDRDWQVKPTSRSGSWPFVCVS